MLVFLFLYDLCTLKGTRETLTLWRLNNRGIIMNTLMHMNKHMIHNPAAPSPVCSCSFTHKSGYKFIAIGPDSKPTTVKVLLFLHAKRLVNHIRGHLYRGLKGTAAKYTQKLPSVIICLYKWYVWYFYGAFLPFLNRYVFFRANVELQIK